MRISDTSSFLKITPSILPPPPFLWGKSDSPLPPPYPPHHFSQLFRKANHPQIKKVASLIEKLLLHFLYEKQIILGA